MENAGGGTEKSQSSTTQGSSSINPAAPSSSLSPPASTAGSPTFVRERERDGRQFIPVLVSEKSSASRSAKLERRLSPLNPYANISNFTAPTSIPSQLTTKTSAVDIPEPSRTSFDEGPSPSLVKRRSHAGIPAGLRRLSRSFSDTDPGGDSSPNASPASSPVIPIGVKPIPIPVLAPIRRLSKSSITSDSDEVGNISPTGPSPPSFRSVRPRRSSLFEAAFAHATQNQPSSSNIASAPTLNQPGRSSAAAIGSGYTTPPLSRKSTGPSIAEENCGSDQEPSDYFSASNRDKDDGIYQPRPFTSVFTSALFQNTRNIYSTPTRHDGYRPELLESDDLENSLDPLPLAPKHLLCMSTSTPELPKWSRPPARSPSPPPSISSATSRRGRPQSIISFQQPVTIDKKISSPNLNAAAFVVERNKSLRTRTLSAAADVSPVAGGKRRGSLPRGPTDSGKDGGVGSHRINQSPFTFADYEAFTTIVEKSRQVKNFRWRPNDPIAVWPTWQDDPPQSRSSSPARGYSRTSSLLESPALNPLAILPGDFRSPSPLFSLDDDGYDDDAASITSSSTSASNRFPSLVAPVGIRPDSPYYSSPSGSLKGGATNGMRIGRQRNSLVITTGRASTPRRGESPGKSPSPPPRSPSGSSVSSQLRPVGSSTAAGGVVTMNRSLSDGDLSDYLKGFSELRNSLRVAKATCNTELERIISELHEGVELGISMPNLSDVRSSAYEFRNKDQAAIFDDVSAQSKLLPAPIKTAHLAATSPSFTQSPSPNAAMPNTPLRLGDPMLPFGSKPPLPNALASSVKTESEGGLQPTAAPLLRHQSSTGISLVSAGSTPPMSSPIMQRSPRLGPLSKLHHSLTSLSLISSSEDSAPSPFITAMTDLIGIAQQILDMDIAQLLTPNSCRFVINRILELQDVWNDHFDWPCKEYLVRLLMVFSTVARLVEHLEEDTRLWSSSLAPASNKQRGVPTVPGQGGRTPKSGWRRDSEMSGLGVELSENGDGDEEDNGGSSKVAESGTETGDSISGRLRDESSLRRSRKKYSSNSHLQSGNESADSSSGTPHLAPRSSIRDLRSRERSPSLFRQESLTLQEFRAVADEGQELNVLIEVGLDGKIAYVSPTVRAVFGYEPQECMVSETSEAVTISTLPFLSKERSDSRVLANAAESLVKNDRVTMEVTYRAQRQDGRWLEMEGKGMLIYDRASGQKRSTVWVTRPIALLGDGWEDIDDVSDQSCLSEEDEVSCSEEEEGDDSEQDDVESAYREDTMRDNHDTRSIGSTSLSVTIEPPTAGLSPTDRELPLPNTDLVFCHICERHIPVLLFEEHNERCSEVHRAEMEVILVNENLRERRTECRQKLGFLESEIENERNQMSLLLKRGDRRSSLSTVILGVDQHRTYLGYIEKLNGIARSIYEAIEDCLSVAIPQTVAEILESRKSDEAVKSGERSPTEPIAPQPRKMPLPLIDTSLRFDHGSLPGSPSSDIFVEWKPPTPSVGFEFKRQGSIDMLPPDSILNSADISESPLSQSLPTSRRQSFDKRASSSGSARPTAKEILRESASTPMSASSSRRQSFAALRLSRIGMWRCPSEADFLPPNSIRGLLSQPNESSIFPDNGVADLGYILFSLGSEVEDLVKSKVEKITRMKTLMVNYAEIIRREDELRLAIAIQTGLLSSKSDNGGSDDGSVSGTSSGDQAGAADESLSDDSDSNTSTNGVETSLPPLSVSQQASIGPKSLNSPVSASLPNSLIHVGPSPSDRVQSPLTVCTIPLVDKSSGPSKSNSTSPNKRGRKKDKNLSKVIRDEEGVRRALMTLSEKESGDVRMQKSQNRKGARPPRVIVSHNRTFDLEKISSPNLSSPISSRFSSFFSTSVPSIPIPTHGLSSGESSASFQLSAGVSPSLAVLTSPNSSSLGSSLQNLGSGESPSSLLPPYGSSAILQRSVPSIKDYEIIKPISKGAFGSVYLAKKRITGDYYAIKVLRKSDMIAKNQVMNIKAERMILSQLDSPFVVKLYFSFQSRDNLYLVMEYLNGGDCAALIKAVGQLDEKWAKQYICEVVLGLEFLHSKGIIHRDLKPDNLLIDHNGHLKLTDFGLSRSGFLGRRAKGGMLDNFLPPNAPAAGTLHPGTPHLNLPAVATYSLPSTPILSALPPPEDITSTHSNSIHPPITYHPVGSMSAGASPSASPLPTTTPPMAPQGVPQGAPQGGVVSLFRMNEHHNRTHSRRSSVASTISTGSIDGSIGPLSIGSRNQENAEDGGKDRKNFAGTPDYLAPESILGLGQDAGVDWWALGVILYEFIYGFPPFHAPTPQDVFENILARRINWLEDEVEVSPECRDMMERLMCTSVEHRFGRNGAEEVKQHFFFADVKWDTLQNSEASFVPKPANAEDTDYFDDRGATNSKLSEGENRVTEEDASPNADDEDSREDVETRSALPKTKQKTPADHDDACSQASDEDAPDFGEFVYKNLPLLEKANSDLVKKLRSDLIALDLKGTPFSASLTGSGVSTPGSLAPPRGRSRNLSMSEAMPAHGLGNSLAGTSSPLTPGTPPPISSPSSSQPQEPSLKTKQRLLDDSKRRNSLPSRLRTQSFGATPSTGFITPPSSNLSTQSSVALIPPGTPTEHPEKRTSIVKSDTPASYLQNAKLALRAQSHGRTLSGVSEPQQEIYPPGPFGGRALDVLIADDNPVACKILEAMLTRMNCRCLVVRNGSEALRYAIGEVKFDVIFMDIRMPIIDGETAARMIKSTKNVNQQTPIIAVTAYEQTFAQTQQFDDVMSKPVTKDLLFKVLAAVAGDHTA